MYRGRLPRIGVGGPGSAQGGGNEMKLGKLAGAVCFSGLLLSAQTTRKPAAPNRDQDSVQAIGKLEEEMRIAILKGTAGWWVEHLSEGYSGTDFQGKVTNRAQTIELQRSTD